jgi:SAM-dependent methyltransferase
MGVTLLTGMPSKTKGISMNRKARRAALKTGGPATNARAASPRNAEAENALTLAVYLRQNGQSAEAEIQFNRAIKLDPTSAEAHHGLAIVLMERDKLDEAMVQLRRALALRPDDPAPKMTLVVLLKQQGNRAAAAAAHESALASHPQSKVFRQQLLDELSAPWTRPADLARASIAFIRLNPVIAACAERSTKAWPQPLSNQDLFGPAGVGVIADDLVLRFLLEACPICDVELERLLTRVRAAVLEMAYNSDTTSAEVTALYCALAAQCFLNDYVFLASNDETCDAERLRDQLIKAIAAGEEFPAIWLPAIASYFPLYTLAGADRLLAKSWPVSISGLLKQQIAEPRQEQTYRAATPVLTPIEHPTSQRVRQQYEENPFPRWVAPAPRGQTITLDSFIRERFPLAPYHDVGLGRDIDILVAGCGTGRHSIETAQRFGSERMLAVDLSLSSLAYAQRQSRACDLGAIQYAQADIMSLPTTARSFDLIECCGVLHHLADPLEGWRQLLRMLRPRGVMLIGLYSELARQDIVFAQRFIAERGYAENPDAIRRCRQDILASPDLRNITAFPAFFNVSECRDMLFHVMEHRLTLPVIATFLAENELKFLGFELDDMTLLRYRNRFPDDKAMTDLGNWHSFEQRNPKTFTAMYQFWVQKRA